MVPEGGGRKGLAEESSSVSVYLDCDVSIYVVATVCISLCERYLVSTVCISRYLSLSASAKGALATYSSRCMVCMHLCERRSSHLLYSHSAMYPIPVCQSRSRQVL